MNEDKVKEFNQFFSNNYNYLLGFSRSIDVKNDYENLLHTCYLKCRDRIEKAGYQGDNYLNFTRVTIMNHYKSDYRQNKKKTQLEFDDVNYQNLIEQTLQNNELQLKNEDDIQHQLSYIINGVYEYLDKYYEEKEKFVFKTYYLLKHKHLNYKQLSDATGYNIAIVSKIIKKIKKDLRENLLTYLKTGNKMEELLEEVRILLTTKSVSRSFEDYRQMYSKITGTQWTGCKCKSSKLQLWMNEWYNNNKK